MEVLLDSILGGSEYVFAQKDDANTNFLIQITSLTTTTFSINCILTGGNYNDMTNGKCVGICPINGVAFAKLDNGFVLSNQFVCGTSNLLVGLILAFLALVF